MNAIKDHSDPIIDSLRKRLAADGWIIDPTNGKGHSYMFDAGLPGPIANISAGFEMPGRNSQWYRLHATLCEGEGYGGLQLSEIDVVQYGAFGKHLTPEQWADKAYTELTDLRSKCDEIKRKTLAMGFSLLDIVLTNPTGNVKDAPRFGRKGIVTELRPYRAVVLFSNGDKAAFFGERELVRLGPSFAADDWNANKP